MTSKLAEWLVEDDLLLPSGLALEQCSSTATAAYKARGYQGERMADLSAGLGVDAYYLARKFKDWHINEPQADLLAYTRHNFAVLGQAAHFYQSTAREVLDRLPPLDLLYLDPSRRSNQSTKVYRLEDCQPEIIPEQERLKQKARHILLKLSPMLDLTELRQKIADISALTVLAYRGEVKELLVEITAENAPPVPPITAVHLTTAGEIQEYRALTGSHVPVELGPPEQYLYEPHGALFKAGLMDHIAQRFKLKKLHPQSHLYTSSHYYSDFQGKVWELIELTHVKNKALKGQRFNVLTRNYPQKASVLAERLRLKPARDRFLIGTTLADGSSVLLVAKWLNL